MKAKLFIVTYDNPTALHDNLTSLFQSDYQGEVVIINNHSHFVLPDQFKDKVNVLHNQTRADFSTGHLARNWNQSLILGFQRLSQPDADLVIHVQDDTSFQPKFFSHLLELHKQYSFIACGLGDHLCSYTPEAVKKIGIWDERFCNIGYQEADYYIRAAIYNREASSINDGFHGRVLNPISLPIINRKAYGCNMTKARAQSMQYHAISKQFFIHKWGSNDLYSLNLGLERTKPLIPTYVTYPYFEKDIENLTEKGYLADFNQPSFPELQKFFT